MNSDIKGQTMQELVKRKSELDTPCLIIDLDSLEKNLHKMQAIVNQAGKKIRPHVKTHKCSALARKQLEAGAVGLCVAKVSEAEVLVREGIYEVLVTGPVVTPRKVERLLDLLETAPSLMVVVDHAEAIDLLDAELKKRGLNMGVLLDLDAGLKRTGVKPQNALKMADYILSRTNLRLRGIQAYAGHIQHIHSYEERKASSLYCLKDAIPVFRKLRDTVPGCDIFSATGTGTFDIDMMIPEITDHQVGSYVVMDAEYLAVGSAEDATRFAPFDPALRLLTTVISVNQDDLVTVDAGLKTLYQDGGVPQILTPAYRNLKYDWFGDEYGKLLSDDPSALPPLGTVLELITSHCDPTVNLFDSYYLVRGEEVVGTWPIDLRGCSQ